MAPERRPSSILNPFFTTLERARQENALDDPNYYCHDPRKSLVTGSTVHTFMTGTGSAIYDSLSTLLASADQELILVTCFWARSSTLTTLNDVLRKLSDKAVRRGTGRIRIRLCFSSLSLLQKLFHSQSVQGQTYPASVWMHKLGLPSLTELSGLDIQIKSVFILPFSVMHPKFMIIDRQTVILPSCNISWEEWFEGCITFSGAVVNNFLQFYNEFWNRGTLPPLLNHFNESGTDDAHFQEELGGTWNRGYGHITTYLPPRTEISSTSDNDIPTVFLPSPHRRNPRFQPFTTGDKVLAPPTPLNTFILTVIAKAAKSIRIQSPNITAPPVLSALLQALERGINITILTSEKLMVLEQLVTAGTTTSRCVKKLIKRYETLLAIFAQHSLDEEAAIATPRPGRLRISYFIPVNGRKPKGQEQGEPQQSHLKMMIVDDDMLILGSGNLDRASWFTSQELGVAFSDSGLVHRVTEVIDKAMEERSKVVFDNFEGRI